jgi:hypothetical protein
MPIRVRSPFFVAAVGLALVLGSTGAAAEIRVGTVDPAAKYTAGGLSMLVSQIGYSVTGVRIAYLVASDKAVGDAVTSYSIEDGSGAVVATKSPAYAGQWVGAHFWTMDLSSIERAGQYRLKAGALTSHAFDVLDAKALYFDPHYEGMMFGQLETRERTDTMGGFIDCGSDIRETNSHVTQMSGMLDMLELHPQWFTADEKSKLEGYLAHFRDFYVGQQQPSGQILGGFWTGSQITMGQWPNHLRGAYGLLRLARHYQGTDEAQKSAMLAHAKQAIDYTDANLPVGTTLATLLSMDLLVQAEYDAQTGDAGALTRAKAVAQELRKRQVPSTKPTPSGLYGLFQDPDSSFSRLNYHAPGDLNGEFWALPLTGVILLSERHPQDADVATWRAIVADFAEGMLKKASSMSPMGLVANGEYTGVRWFSDLFHGMSMTYGIVAAEMVRYGEFLGDPSLNALAEKQLLWVGGLNTGSGFPSAAVPFSCIVGKGYQWLNDGYGTYSGIAGSIVNGLSATPQFTKQMPSGPEQPLYLCDESWISHTGGWLSGTAALLHAIADAPVDGGVVEAGRDAVVLPVDARHEAPGSLDDARVALEDHSVPPVAGDDAAVDTSQDEPATPSGCACRTAVRASAPWGAMLVLAAAWTVRVRKRDACALTRSRAFRRPCPR